ncbi:MAG: hypothetical protein ACJ76J_05065 [Thermoanaerobaculia bacterium]
MNDEKLREILRQGDPAAGDPGLTPEEVQGMRRAVLSAVPEPRRRGWLVPALATAAALIVAAVIAVSLWPSSPKEVVAVRPPLPLAGEGRGEGSVQPEKTPPLPSPAAQEREPPARPRKKKIVHHEPEPVVVAQVEPPAAPEAPHQIQFSTPGGTRIIWVLHPATE